MNLKFGKIKLYNGDLNELSNAKLLINTINAHSYNLAQKDSTFANALKSSDVLLPDGISIVLAVRFLFGERIKKIAGADLFFYEMNRLNESGGKCFFLGSSNETLTQITKNVKQNFPKVTTKTYSPPYVAEFSLEDSNKMVAVVNQFQPDVLFIGMTAPKQEKWAYQHFEELKAQHICSIGAVFDFFAGNIKRAPNLIIKLGLEWFYRLIKEPQRLWRRYLLGNFKFIQLVVRERLFD